VQDYSNQRTISSIFIPLLTTAGQRTILRTIRKTINMNLTTFKFDTLNTPRNTQKLVSTQKRSFLSMHSAKIHHFTIFFHKSFLNLSKPRGVNTAKADRTMTAQSEKSIICKKPRLTALHAGIVLTPPLLFSQSLYSRMRITSKTVHDICTSLCFHIPGYNQSCGISTLAPGLRPELSSAPLARGPKVQTVCMSIGSFGLRS
jgi:endonuclease IV